MKRALGALAVLAAVGCGSRASEESAVRRGDLAFAQGDMDEAIAEYQLAVRQGSDDPETLMRVAHTYARLGRVDDAGDYYLRAVDQDEGVTDQAVSDLIWLARESRTGGDGFAMATAVEAALRLRPGLGVADLSLPLARHYFQNGEYGRALPFYLNSIGEAAEPQPETLFEIGQAYDEIGDCEHALVFFERFRERVRVWQRGEVDWYIGRCSFSLAREVREGRRVQEDSDSAVEELVPPPESESEPELHTAEEVRRLEAALRLVERTIEVGEPRQIQAQAWFEKGDLLAELGECQGAMDAYAHVRVEDPSGSLADRAQAAFDEIRFGQGLEPFRDGRCR